MPSISFTQLEIQASLEYWTPERMANARPAPLLHVEMPERSQQKYDAFSQAETAMSFCSAEGEKYEHVSIAAVPYRKIGRLYYKSAAGEDLYATAQVVDGADVLLTAAHCLKVPGDDEGWSTDIVFDRGYQNKKKNQTMLIAVGFINVPDGWEESDSIGITRAKWDYAFVKTTTQSNHGNLMLSLGIPLALKAIGYPNNYGNKQEYMCYVDGVQGDATNGYRCMYGNYMDKGAAGGGWFAYDYGSFVYGLNSTNDGTGLMYGPVFDSNVLSLLHKTLLQPMSKYK